MINNNFHREILSSVINTSKYNLDNNDVNNVHACYQIYSMIEAWHSGITILKNAQGDRIETDYDGKHWYIYEFIGEKGRNKNQLSVEPIKFDATDHVTFINKINNYINTYYVPVSFSPFNNNDGYILSEEDHCVNNSLNGWNHDRFPLFV